MILSMTGYGKGVAEQSGISAEVEVRSVNSKFLDIFLRLPKTLNFSELELREIIKIKVKRGKILVNVQVKRNGLDASSPSIDKEKVKYYISLLKEIKKSAKLKDKITMDQVISFKELLYAEDESTLELELKLIKEALESSLIMMMKMKQKEGDELAKDMIMRCKTIEGIVKTIISEAENSAGEYFEKVKEKAKQLVKDISNYNDRLELELALLSEKVDTTEECVRLQSHIKFFLEAIKKENEAGKKLNFISQEMLREANTISSKSVSIGVIHHSVRIKEEIEKIKEQIQNIE